mmetsp:Transcript_13310/g.40276  ORF Transcript_13310/g.40276 Transcript_13310/m.40276 type:complete len:730 (-) Transcript_13310:513-2702(-)
MDEAVHQAEEPLLQTPSRRSNWNSKWIVRCMCLVPLLVVLAYAGTHRSEPEIKGGQRSFGIENNRFMLDGEPFQIISGSIHYSRIHPAYWRDRLLRVKSMGLNAIQFYVPWNQHEVTPGNFTWENDADVEGFIKLAAELDLLVLLRPGPYICAEWDFGGLPSWLASSKVEGGRTMKLRSSDPVYLKHVDAWWAALLPRMEPLLYANGGPIVMVQMENEYGFCGSDKVYLRHLVATARQHLGDGVILYTTDPPHIVLQGSLRGDDVYTVVDFGPKYFWLRAAFTAQRVMNPSGKSPPFNSEYYTGWLTHWGEPMANTSSTDMANTMSKILAWDNGFGSINLYMAHGGTNFGYWAGANVDKKYWPHITSYDYDAPISEAGSTGQPGIGGPSKFEIIRDVIQKHTGVEAPAPEAPPRIAAMGSVKLSQFASLLDSAKALAGSAAADVQYPDIMEEYGQSGGLIVYRIQLPINASGPLRLGQANTLDFKVTPHDYVHVLVNGKRVGDLHRDQKPQLSFVMPAADSQASQASSSSSPGSDPSTIPLDVVVQAVGRSNFGCDWDTKGLQSPNVTLNGKPLVGWQVLPLQLENLSIINFSDATTATEQSPASSGVGVTVRLEHGPVFYRGTFKADKGELGGGEHPPDTFLAMPGFVKGLAWVNGFNLGWYWPAQGPQQRLYVPGPVLKHGENEVVLLEVEGAPVGARQVDLVDTPDFTQFQPLADQAKTAQNRGVI